MTWNLFLDDYREPPDSGINWTIARTGEEAVAMIQAQGCPQFVSFDHDLGEGMTGYDFAKWIINEAVEERVSIPEDFKFRVHSANPVGARNIQQLLDHYLQHR